jgi:hypothetical protein
MSLYRLCLLEDRPGPDAAWELGAAVRVLYVREGAVGVGPGDGLVVGAAQFGEGPLRLRAARSDPPVLWRFELRDAASEIETHEFSTLKLAAQIELDPEAEYLFRCDRVDLRPGTVTPKHTHAGPGIRCLLQGDVRAEIGGERSFHRAGEAWFERGPDPVVGTMSPLEPTSFIRGLILPAALRGATSYRPWDETAAARPLPAQYRILVDQPFALPPPSRAQQGT